MSALNLVEYDSDEEANQKPNKPTITNTNNQKPPEIKQDQSAQKANNSSQKEKQNEAKDSNIKKVIKYSSLQTSKNLLDKADVSTNEEWKPTTMDFSKKNDPNSAAAEKSTFKPKKGNSFAASFLTNLPKPKRELKNVSKNLVISDSYSYEKDSTDEVITKKVKKDPYANLGDALEGVEGEEDAADVAPFRNRPAATFATFSEQDREFVYQHDKSNKIGDISRSEIIEIKADNLADPDWEMNMEKRVASRMFDSKFQFSQPDKLAKSKNHLMSLAYEAVTKQDELQAQKVDHKEARKKTFQKYGW